MCLYTHVSIEIYIYIYIYILICEDMHADTDTCEEKGRDESARTRAFAWRQMSPARDMRLQASKRPR